MSSIEYSGDQQHTKWGSANSYPFYARLVGKGIYEGNAVGGDGAWDGADGAPGYFTLDGTLQDLLFKVEENHRLVFWEFRHTDAAGNPSAANYNLDVEYQTKGTLLWSRIYDAVPGVVNHHAEFGETFERLQGQYRIRLQGTAGHFIYITPRIQTLKVNAFKGKRNNP